MDGRRLLTSDFSYNRPFHAPGLASVRLLNATDLRIIVLHTGDLPFLLFPWPPFEGINRMTHNDITRSEFTHQAAAMAAHAKFTSGSVVDWFRESLVAIGPGRVLDLACGPGILAAELAPHADHLSGIDITPKMIELARDRCLSAGLANVEFHEGTVESLPFDANSFDSVVTRLSFHHFEDVPAVLSEVARILKPGGNLLVADIVSSSDPTDARLQNALENLRDPSHLWMFSEEALLKMLASASFSTESMTTASLERTFAEWAAIVANARSLESLEVVMRRLAEVGLEAGIGLRIIENMVHFDHHWRLILSRLS